MNGPFSNIVVLCIENTNLTPAALEERWNKVWDILEQRNEWDKVTALAQLPKQFPELAAPQIGGDFVDAGGTLCRIYQNPFFPNDACCGLQLRGNGNKIGWTTNLGGEWLVADVARGDFLMLYKAVEDGKESLYMDFNEGQSTFRDLTPSDLLPSALSAKIFNEARRRAGASAEALASMRDSGRTRRFDSLTLGG